MLIIGLTGGIGSGKSIVAKVFKSLNVPVYDSDHEAKQLYLTDLELKSQLMEQFGEDLYNESGEFNRNVLSKLVFNDPQKLKQLNEIVHPRVRDHFKSWTDSHKKDRLVLKEAAILIESGAYKTCDKIILVKAIEETRINRVIERDNSNREEVISRIKRQMTDKEKESFADYVINNNSDQMILPQIYQIYSDLLKY